MRNDEREIVEKSIFEKIERDLDTIKEIENGKNEVFNMPRFEYETYKDVHEYVVQQKMVYAVGYWMQKVRLYKKNEFCMNYFNELRKLLTVKDVLGGYEWIRVGKQGDGGYVMLNHFDDITCAYSLGINDDVSWDEYFAKERNVRVYMYDHTIDSLPEEHENFVWRKIGVSNEDCGSYKRISSLINEDGNGSSGSMLLKMDIEGYEWKVIADIEVEMLNKFDQIVLELHDVCDINKAEEILSGLSKMNLTHQLVYIHGNNNGMFFEMEDCNIPNYIEVTYVNKSKYNFCKSKRFFPTGLDQPNSSYYPDIPLGMFN